ncbi:MAG: hypothetical protein HGJ94_12425 [Desulfosarcina sp.]|nr:hypothetical protein [Desulfosarcina sp.]MBC2742090.1 hypothetical protein [Desulfosarcina sp.]MBC2765003.1 hypothetical protein [Desulfosarcina sp.]
MAASTRGHFVSAALDQNDDRASISAQPQDSEQIQRLIEEAFNKGIDQGRAETIGAQQEKVENATVALNAAVEEMVRIRQQDIERMETETVRLALAIAKKIIGSETEHGPVIGHVVKAAMKKVAGPRHLTLRLNPKDIDTVKGSKRELFLADDPGSVFRIEADETIQRGGCIIETKLGDVDARIDQQIKIIEELLTAELPKHFAER